MEGIVAEICRDLLIRSPKAANSPRCEASKLSSDDPREFPAALGRKFPGGSTFRNWGRSEMIATQHAVVQAKAYWTYV